MLKDFLATEGAKGGNWGTWLPELEDVTHSAAIVASAIAVRILADRHANKAALLDSAIADLSGDEQHERVCRVLRLYRRALELPLDAPAQSGV